MRRRLMSNISSRRRVMLKLQKRRIKNRQHSFFSFQTMDAYGVKKIITACPHCFNTIKNEYPALGGNYDVIHHTQFIHELFSSGKIAAEGGTFKGKTITYHDSCDLGCVIGDYKAARKMVEFWDANLVEMNRCKTNGLCCGAGGAQMFKEDEPGDKGINIERVEEAIETGSQVVAANCPFCITMMSDGLKGKEKQDDIMLYDLAELIVQNNNW